MAKGWGAGTLAVLLTAAGCDGGRPGTGGRPPPTNDAAAPEGDGAVPGADGAVDAGQGDTGAPDASGAETGTAATGLLFQILDDMEGGNPSLPTPVGLASWFLRRPDSVAPIAAEAWAYRAPEPPRDVSTKAQHLVVTDPAGADLLIDLHGPAFTSGGTPYPDLAAYAGIAFWARRGAASGNLTVAIQDDTQVAHPVYAVARALPQPWFEHDIELTSEWRRHILLFDDFRQPGSTTSRLHTQAVWSVHLLAGLDGSGADVWIDDLALLCRGQCPAPPWNPTMSAAGVDDASLTWASGDPATNATGCAVLSVLSMTSLPELRADPLEKVILRVRIPAPVPPRVPLWAWRIQNAATGAVVEPIAIDEGWTTVAVPLTEPGDYQIIAHTHYPGTDTCGVKVAASVR